MLSEIILCIILLILIGTPIWRICAFAVGIILLIRLLKIDKRLRNDYNGTTLLSEEQREDQEVKIGVAKAE